MTRTSWFFKGGDHRRHEGGASVELVRHALPGARHGPAQRADLRRDPQQRLLRAARHQRRSRSTISSNLGPLAIREGHLNVSDEPGMGEDFDWAWVERTALADGLNRLAMRAIRDPSSAAPSRLRRAARASGSSTSRRAAAGPISCSIPSLLLILAVVIYPTGWGIGLSFREMRLNRPDLGTGFVGLKHYIALAQRPDLLALAARTRACGWRGAVAGELLLGLAAPRWSLNRGLIGFRAVRRARAAALVPAQRGGRPHVGADARSAARRDQRPAGDRSASSTATRLGSPTRPPRWRRP